MANIGKYRLEEEIGRGGFGQVYRAFDPAMGRMVAIKILLSQKDKDLLARFKNEANSTGKLRHRNIVTVYDYGEHENKPYLVMEYLEGEDLQMIEASGRTVSLLEKTSIVSQIAEGLQHAHHNGVVHRDVKPANIMILRDGTAKIMDFGIARVLVEPARLTQQGSLLGTLSYMAPEVFQGTDVDHLCDIFSLGVIFYELITSKHPFAADAPGRVIYNITSVHPPSIVTLVPDCPPGLDHLISRAMQKDRELRYQSMDDLLLDLAPIRLQLQAKEARSLIQKAESLFSTQQIQGAQELLVRALLLDPNNKTGRELREKISREANRQVLRDKCDQLLASAQEHFAGERFPKAIEVLENLIRLDPERIEAQTLLDQVRKAQRTRERVAALIAQARRELEEEKLTGAYRSILECFQHAPDNKEAAALMETIRASIERRERERRLAENLAKVEGLMQADQPEEAENLLVDLEMNYPGAERVRQLAIEVRVAIQEKKRRRELAEAMEGARTLLQDRRWEEAVATLRRIQARFPNEPEVVSLAGYAEEELQAQQKADFIERVGRETRLSCENHDFDRAVRLLRSALESYPREPAFEAMLERTTHLQSEYQIEKAMQAARDKASALASSKNFPAALAELDRALNTRDSAELHELRARIEADGRAYERSQAIQKAGNDIQNLISQNKFNEAAALAADALKTFPGEASLLAAADMVRTREAEHARRTRIAAACEKAAGLSQSNQFSTALQLVEDSLREFPAEPSLLAMRHKIAGDEQEYRRKALANSANAIKNHIGRRDYQGAIDAGQEALKKFQGDTIIEGLLNVAQLALAEEKRAIQISQARADAQKLAASGDFEKALALVRETLGDLGPDSSLEALEDTIERQRAEEQKRKAVAALLAEAARLTKSGSRQKAIAALENGLKEHSESSAISTELSRLREEEERVRKIEAAVQSAKDALRAQKPEAALQTIRAALDSFPGNDQLIKLSAEIKAEITKKEGQRVIRGAMQSAAALEQQGHLAGAAQILEQALAKAPGDAALIKELGRIRDKIARQAEIDAALDNARHLLAEDRLDEAAQCLQDAIEKSSGDPALSVLLDEVKKKKRAAAIASAVARIEASRAGGNLEQTMIVVNEVQSSFPNEPTVIAARSRVESDMAARVKQEKVAAIAAQAQKLLEQQKVEEAKKTLEAGLAECPGEPELTTLFAYADEILAARRRADEISELARKAKKLIQEGKSAEAENILAQGVAKYPGEDSLRALVEAAQAATSAQETQQKLRRVLDAAETHRKKKRWDEALAALESGIRDLGSDASLRQARETILSEKRAFEQAEAAKELAKTTATGSGSTKILTPGSEDFPRREDTVMISPQGEIRPVAQAPPPEIEKRKEPAPRKETRQPQPVSAVPPVPAPAQRKKIVPIAIGLLLLVGVIAIIALVGNSFLSDDEPAVVAPPADAPAAPVPLAGRILHFYADPSSVPSGGMTTICYGVENATSLRLEPPIADVEPSANRCFEHKPTATADYRLTVVGTDGSETSETFTVGVEVQPVTEVGRLRVETGESNVDVIVGNDIRRRTGRTGAIEIPLEPGTYRVAVEKEGYDAPPPQQIPIVAGQTRTFKTALKERPTRIVVSGAAAGTSVTLNNGIARTVPPGGTLILDTVAGTNTITLRRDGFVDKAVVVSLDTGESLQLTPSELAMAAIPKPVAPPPAETSRAPDPPPSAVEWGRVRNSTNIAELTQFVNAFPTSPEAAEAKRRIASLEEAARADAANRAAAAERAAWDQVDQNSVQSLEQFLARFPTGTFAADARDALERVKTAQQRLAERKAVMNVLANYASAYQSENLQALLRIFPTMSPNFRSVTEETFRNSREITYNLRATVEDVVVSGNTAVVTCIAESQVVDIRGTRLQPVQDRTRIDLQRDNNGVWTIRSLTRLPN